MPFSGRTLPNSPIRPAPIRLDRLTVLARSILSDQADDVRMMDEAVDHRCGRGGVSRCLGFDGVEGAQLSDDPLRLSESSDSPLDGPLGRGCSP